MATFRGVVNCGASGKKSKSKISGGSATQTTMLLSEMLLSDARSRKFSLRGICQSSFSPDFVCITFTASCIGKQCQRSFGQLFPSNADMHAVPAQCRLERVILFSICLSRWTRKRLHAVSVTLVEMRTSRVLLKFGAAFCSVVLHQGNMHGNHWHMLYDGRGDLLRLPRSHPSSSSFYATAPPRRCLWSAKLDPL